MSGASSDRRGWFGRVLAGLVTPTPPPQATLDADALVHDLRVPLSALAGEVELALLRERSPAAYREALARIGGRVGEVIQLTDDLAFVGGRDNDDASGSQTAHLGQLFARLQARMEPGRQARLRLDAGDADVRVQGEETRLARALTLMLEHALKHAHKEAAIDLRARRAANEAFIGLSLQASPHALSSQQWRHLDALARAGSGGQTCPFGLLTAFHIIHRCGGWFTVTGPDEAAVLLITLRRASDGHAARKGI